MMIAMLFSEKFTFLTQNSCTSSTKMEALQMSSREPGAAICYLSLTDKRCSEHYILVKAKLLAMFVYSLRLQW